MCYKISGSAPRREFDLDTLDLPLNAHLFNDAIDIESTNGDCTFEEGAKGQLSATCKPSAP